MVPPGWWATSAGSFANCLSWNASKPSTRRVRGHRVRDNAYPRGFDIKCLNPIVRYRPVIRPGSGQCPAGVRGERGGQATRSAFNVMLDETVLQEVRAGDGWVGEQAGRAGPGSWPERSASFRASLRPEDVRNLHPLGHPPELPATSGQPWPILQVPISWRPWWATWRKALAHAQRFSFVVMGRDTGRPMVGATKHLPAGSGPAPA